MISAYLLGKIAFAAGTCCDSLGIYWIDIIRGAFLGTEDPVPGTAFSNFQRARRPSKARILECSRNDNPQSLRNKPFDIRVIPF